MTDSTILQPEGLEQRYKRYKEKIKHFTIMNDIFMRNVLKEISYPVDRSGIGLFLEKHHRSHLESLH